MLINSTTRSDFCWLYRLHHKLLGLFVEDLLDRVVVWRRVALVPSKDSVDSFWVILYYWGHGSLLVFTCGPVGDVILCLVEKVVLMLLEDGLLVRHKIAKVRC